MTYLFIDLPISSSIWRESFRVIVNHFITVGSDIKWARKTNPIQVEISLAFFLCFSNHQNQVHNVPFCLSNGFQYYFGFVSWKYSFYICKTKCAGNSSGFKMSICLWGGFFCFCFFLYSINPCHPKMCSCCLRHWLFIHRLFKDS